MHLISGAGLSLIVCLAAGGTPPPGAVVGPTGRTEMSPNRIVWLGHSSIRIEGEKTVYIDPWKLPPAPPPADLILITHSHHDHCSARDVEALLKKDTVIIATPDCAGELPAGFRKISPGRTETVGGVIVTAVPAYNLNKPFHPREKGWVGYIVEMGGERIYQAGDTDYIPEIDGLLVDVAILPVGGTYTMNPEEAAAAANHLKVRLAIPIHYGSVVGSRADAEKFKNLCRVPVEILKKQ